MGAVVVASDASSLVTGSSLLVDGVGQQDEYQQNYIKPSSKRAGVSQSAVSRVFTPGASASQSTIDKVKKLRLISAIA